MAAWVFYHRETNDTLGSRKLITLGYPDNQCSYRSKMSGIYGIASTIRELALYHDLQGGALTVACDGKSALHRCFKSWNSNPLSKHFNLIQATQATIKATPIKWAWEHVRGDQDDHDQPLTTTEQCNVDMDREAKTHWIENHTNRHSQQVRFHGKTWRIFLGPKKISTNLKYHLLDHTAGQSAQNYWAGKARFQGLDTKLVDWETIEKVVSNQTITMRRWTTKFTTGFCVTGCRMVQIKL